MSINWNEILAYALEGLIPVVIGVVGILIKNVLSNKVANEQLRTGLEDAWDLLVRAVTDTNQIYIDELKSSQDGLTEE